MTDKFNFWAQALDNLSPDYIEMRGKVLASHDTVRRQEVVSLVSKIVKTGSRVFESQGLLLTANTLQFVMEVPSVQRDQAGRIAPIVCCGDYDDIMMEAISAAFIVDLKAFVKCIGRTLQPIHLELANESLAALKIRSSKRMIVCKSAITLSAVALILLLLRYWMTSKGS